MPLLAIDLGMSKSLTGLYMASSFLLLLTGSLLAGYLADKIRNIKILLNISIALFAVFIVLHSLVNKPAHLFAATSILWFISGFQSILINTLQGVRSKREKKGVNYAKLVISTVTGAIIGSLVIGGLLKFYSIKIMFYLLSSIAVFSFVISMFIKEQKNTNTKIDSFIRFNNRLFQNKQLILFFLSSIAISVVNYILLLSISLLMKEKGYEYSEISFIVAIGIIFSVPFVFFFGRLSDKKGRKIFLLLSYVSSILALLLLISATSAIIFILVVFFKSIMVYSRSTVSFALINDIATKKNLGKIISYLGSTIWIGGIIGYLITGILIDSVGFTNTFIIGAFIALLAIYMLYSSYKYSLRKI